MQWHLSIHQITVWKVEDIKVYPGDKVVIKKPSFYIKNFKRFSLAILYNFYYVDDKEGKFSIFSINTKTYV